MNPDFSRSEIAQTFDINKKRIVIYNFVPGTLATGGASKDTEVTGHVHMDDSSYCLTFSTKQKRQKIIKLCRLAAKKNLALIADLTGILGYVTGNSGEKYTLYKGTLETIETFKGELI
jgi:hypothetical protein